MTRYKNWFRSLFMWPGVTVVIGAPSIQYPGLILKRESGWNVRVWSNGCEQVWWRGNLRIVL